MTQSSLLVRIKSSDMDIVIGREDDGLDTALIIGLGNVVEDEFLNKMNQVK